MISQDLRIIQFQSYTEMLFPTSLQVPLSEGSVPVFNFLFFLHTFLRAKNVRCTASFQCQSTFFDHMRVQCLQLSFDGSYMINKTSMDGWWSAVSQRPPHYWNQIIETKWGVSKNAQKYGKITITGTNKRNECALKISTKPKCALNLHIFCIFTICKWKTYYGSFMSIRWSVYPHACSLNRWTHLNQCWLNGSI